MMTPNSDRSPYRVLFRRNISLIRGCVKCTSPFLDMLVTRSLWSNMCKSIFLSVASAAAAFLFVCACGGDNALLRAERYHSNVQYRGPGKQHYPTSDDHLAPLSSTLSQKTKKHPKQPDSSAQLNYCIFKYKGQPQT